MYARPTVDGEPVTFGVSGRLWRDSLVLYDRSTRSLWSQVAGRAVAGPLAGRRLEEVPSELTTWGAWKRRHPDTLVLAKGAEEALADARRGASAYAGYHADPDRLGIFGRENPDPRLPAKTLVVGIEGGERAAALSLARLEGAPVANVTAGGRPLVVVSPPGETAVRAWERTVAGEVLEFTAVASDPDGLALRSGDGTLWSWRTGECLAGPDAETPCGSRRLAPVEASVAYWGVWAQFHPEAEVIELGG